MGLLMASFSDRRVARRQYKLLLSEIIGRCPYGTKQRISRAIGSSRGFVSQVLNPDSEVPLPEKHVPVLMKVCQFSEGDAAEFMELYEAAHPRRHTGRIDSGGHSITISLPEFRSQEQRAAVEEAILEMAEKIVAASLSANRRRSRK